MTRTQLERKARLVIHGVHRNDKHNNLLRALAKKRAYYRDKLAVYDMAITMLPGMRKRLGVTFQDFESVADFYRGPP